MLKLKHACSTFAIQQNFEYSVVESGRRCYIIKLKEENCAWGLTLTIQGGSVKVAIKFFVSAHTYMSVNHLRHAQASITAISSKIVNKLHKQPQYHPKEILQDIQYDDGIHLS